MIACGKPTPFETIVALWTGELPEEEAAIVEEHLFSCDECARASDRFTKLALGLREVISPVISHAHRDRLVAMGKRICNTPVEASRTARARFAPDVDLLVHVLKADLSRADSVDVEVVDPEGVQRFLFEHVPFDASAGEVLLACQRHYEAMFSGDPIFRLHGTEASERTRIGDYLVEHLWR